MKAAQYIKAGEISYNEIPTPAVAADEIRIKVSYCGICGTDIHVFKGHMDKRVTAPQAVGHEISGIVSAVGKSVTGFGPGDKVTVRPLDNCGECNTCKLGFTHICEKLRFLGVDSPGGFAEFWTVPARLVHHLPNDLSLQVASLIEPLAVACHDVKRSGLKAGDYVIVNGAGPIGMLIALVCRQAGGRVTVVEVNPARLKIATDMGFATINPGEMDLITQVRQETGGSGADIVFEVSGSEAGAKAMTELTRPRGTIVMVAIYAQPVLVDLHKFFWKELTMLGARVYETVDYEQAIDLATQKTLPLEQLISRVFPLDKLQDAVEFLCSTPDAMKILIKCDANCD